MKRRAGNPALPRGEHTPGRDHDPLQQRHPQSQENPRTREDEAERHGRAVTLPEVCKAERYEEAASNQPAGIAHESAVDHTAADPDSHGSIIPLPKVN